MPHQSPWGVLEVSIDSLTFPSLCTERVWAIKLPVTVGLRGIQMHTLTSSCGTASEVPHRCAQWCFPVYLGLKKQMGNSWISF